MRVATEQTEVHVFAPHHEAPTLVELAADILPGAGCVAHVREGRGTKEVGTHPWRGELS